MPFIYELLAYIYLWSMRARTRRALAKLEPHELVDIGMTKQQRGDEVANWFWQGVPPRRSGMSALSIFLTRAGLR
ncbi:MAG: DUF1127 domain-containing protein [Hyphomicrobiales bacterium]|nr:DUF1127 domain-containing protein [Hyphomicrobiales bacterium]